MRKVGVIGFLVAAGITAAGGLSAREIEFQAGSWPGVIVYDDQNGSFQDCYIWSDYKSQITVYFQIDYDQTFHIAFTHPDWRLNVGDEFNVVLEVDNTLSETYRASAYSENGVDIIFTSPGGLLDILRYGRLMRIHAQQDSFHFELRGTKVALDRLYDCYRENAVASGSTKNPFQSGGSGSSNPFQGTDANPFMSNQGQQASTGNFRSDGVGLFESLLQDSRMGHFRILRGNEIPEGLSGRDLVWGTGSTWGGLSVVEGEISPEAETTRLAAEDSQTCKGEVASAAVNSVMSNGEVVRRLAVSCIESGSSWYTYYSIYRTFSPTGAFYVTHVAVNDQIGAKSADQAIFDMISNALGSDVQ